MQPAAAGGGSAYETLVSALVDDAAAAAPLYMQTWWDRTQERYQLDDVVLTPGSVTISARFAAGSAGACVWSIDGVESLQPCEVARLTLHRTSDGLRGIVAVRTESGKSARTCAAVAERLIVGLGDSYASGEGNPDRPTRWAAVPAVANAPSVAMPVFRDGRDRDRLGLWDRQSNGPLASVPAAVDAQWWDNSCHRSLLSQQALGAMAYAAANRHRRVLFLSFACSGATIYDGVAGPRLEAPGPFRPGGLGTASPALQLSQLEQLVHLLCARPGVDTTLIVPREAPTWRMLTIRGKRARAPRGVRVPRCDRFRVLPDAILLSVGGNDVGFGGVGAWSLLPPSGRLPIDVIPLVNKVFGGGAAKGGFGLVCPGRERESRCKLNTAILVGELPVMFGLLDQALATAGLGSVKTRVHASYPIVTQAEDGKVRGCFGDNVGGELYELLDEPWLPAYATILDLPLVRTDRLGRWSFGIRQSEMRIIDREVLAPLNTAIAAHTGWTIIRPAAMPLTHGICAADGELATLLQAGTPSDRIRALTLSQFGWPRFVNGGWSSDRPTPVTWRPYADRARWIRTATDAALTQSALDGGTAAPKRRDRSDRLGEALSGGLHLAMPMHAAIGEQLAANLEQTLP